MSSSLPPLPTDGWSADGSPPPDDALTAWAAGELPPEDARAVEAWLTAHPEGAVLRARLEATEAALSGLRLHAEPPDLAGRILTGLRTRPTVRRPGSVRRAVLGLAAAVLVAVGLWQAAVWSGWKEGAPGTDVTTLVASAGRSTPIHGLMVETPTASLADLPGDGLLLVVVGGVVFGLGVAGTLTHHRRIRQASREAA